MVVPRAPATEGRSAHSRQGVVTVPRVGRTYRRTALVRAVPARTIVSVSVITRSPIRRGVAAAAGRPALPMPRELLDATTEADLVTIPARSVLSIDGSGEPGSDRFQRSLKAAYGITFTLKFARKKSGRPDFGIGPLEGRWWSDQILPCARAPRRTWRWTLRMAIPRNVTATEVAHAIEAATTKRGGALEDSDEARHVRLERLPRQRVGRIMHVGPYATESASLTKVRDEIERHGFSCADRHIEIYLGDPRRTRPDRLRTVLLRELTEEGPAR